MNQKSVLKKLKNKAERLWKEACLKRDGYKCAYCGVKKEDGYILQVDHCFSRMNSALFLEVKNGTTLCKSEHFRKTHKIDGMDRIVDHLVIHREGAEWFGEAEAIYMAHKPFVMDIFYLENKIKELSDLL